MTTTRGRRRCACGTPIHQLAARWRTTCQSCESRAYWQARAEAVADEERRERVEVDYIALDVEAALFRARTDYLFDAPMYRDRATPAATRDVSQGRRSGEWEIRG